MVFQRLLAFLSNTKGFTTLQAAGAFAVIALVSAVFIPGIYGEPNQRFAAFRGGPTGIDATVTGTVAAKPQRVKRYTIRRSVLQKDPNTPCIVYEDGTQEGGC
ncbi:MAG: hypothetical protein AAGI12_14245 [Pseudomonadota bacterium]